MKTNELRLGNIIQYNGFSGYTVFGLSDFKDLYEDDCEIGRVSPIPLTEAWLVKFGFEWSKAYDGVDQWTYGLFYLYGMNDDNEYVFGLSLGDMSPEVKYVHQLQNLYFALTGEELTIKD